MSKKRKNQRKKRRMPSIFWIGASAFIFVIWLTGIWAQQPIGRRGAVAKIELRPGISYWSIAHRLAAKDVLDMPVVAYLYFKLSIPEQSLRHGTMAFFGNTTPAAMRRQMSHEHGRARVRVVVPEGLNMFTVAARLHKQGVCGNKTFLRSARDDAFLTELGVTGDSVEGYLFPDTYDFLEGSSPRKVIRTMVSRAHQQFAKACEDHPAACRARKRGGMSERDLMTLASIIEKETGLASERLRVAGVFHNRLNSKTFQPRRRLQADPTVAYGCLMQPSLQTCRNYRGSVSAAMVRDRDNNYNTYQRAGLPPGPIANPGAAAIAAAIAPEKHGYLYFVATGKGGHRFSKTYKAHERAVGAYQKALGR